MGGSLSVLEEEQALSDHRTGVLFLLASCKDIAVEA